MMISPRMTYAALALIAVPCGAAGFEDLERLETRIVAVLGAEIGSPGGPMAPIDRRMKLLACPEPALIDAPMAGAIAVRCQTVGWRIRVPLVRTGGSAVQGRGGYAAVERQAAVVRRGDPVELRAGNAGFAVSTQVIAQEDGAPGQRIRVKGEGKSGPMIVEVVEAGFARIPGFK